MDEQILRRESKENADLGYVLYLVYFQVNKCYAEGCQLNYLDNLQKKTEKLHPLSRN